MPVLMFCWTLTTISNEIVSQLLSLILILMPESIEIVTVWVSHGLGDRQHN